MVELIVNYAKERRDVDYLHVWLSDARNNICECEHCQKDLPSDQYVRILNQLDEALTKEGLDTKICFLLYHELLFAPEKEKLKNPERFTMMFAPITRTFEMSYEDVNYETDVPEPKAYVRNKIVLPNSLEENLSYLFAWKKMFDGDSFVYDYPAWKSTLWRPWLHEDQSCDLPRYSFPEKLAVKRIYQLSGTSGRISA
mgnify:CR=1 FL=1